MKNTNIADETLEDLHAVLDKQIELAEKVLSITGEEKKALIDMDTDSLFSLARSKSDNLDTISACDAEIRSTLAEITADSNTSRNNPVKLLDLLPFLGAEEATRLKDKRNRLAELRKKIISDNIVNQNFTTNVLGYLEDAVALIVNGIQENPIYNRQKRGLTDKSRPALLSREI